MSGTIWYVYCILLLWFHPMGSIKYVGFSLVHGRQIYVYGLQRLTYVLKVLKDVWGKQANALMLYVIIQPDTWTNVSKRNGLLSLIVRDTSACYKHILHRYPLTSSILSIKCKLVHPYNINYWSTDFSENQIFFSPFVPFAPYVEIFRIQIPNSNKNT